MPARDRILLIGDREEQVQNALRSAAPSAEVCCVPGVFHGIHELSRASYGTVLLPAEPIERRPEPAVRTLRELIGQGRLILFGHPTLEPLSRKMLEFGVDDYLVTPASVAEIQQVLGEAPLRVVRAESAGEEADGTTPALAGPVDRVASLLGLPLAEILLESLQSAPHAAFSSAIAAIDARIGPTMRLMQLSPSVAPPAPPEGMTTLSHPVWLEKVEKSVLHLTIPRDDDQTTARHFLAQLAHLAGRLLVLQEQFAGLKHLSITD
ncbi:MAG: hypothetical protein RMJ35_08995 [Phycisphaerales bacterium]|nr:hypothetical protein [Phycisphaerales bacterium]